MKSKKLSTKDWKSPVLGLVGQTKRPKIRDVVCVKCVECGLETSKTFRDVIRAVNTHLKYASSFLCPACLRTNTKYINECRIRSLNAKSLILRGASQRSKDLWMNGEYRSKMAANHINLSTSKEFKKKVSKSIKAKFTDADYVRKIKAARKLYWKDKKYRESRLSNLKDFLEAAQRVHGTKYDYSDVKYVNSRTKVCIICPVHGQFKQRPSHHIHYANGCPNCRPDISAPQLEIKDWLSSIGFDTIDNDRSTLPNGLELDIYIPTKRIAIEYHGGFWHSFDRLETTAQRLKHYNKASAATSVNVTLLQILDSEWAEREDVVKSMIRNKLGLSSKIYARHCTKHILPSGIAKSFFDSNHLCKNRSASSYFGLLNDGVLVAAASISRVSNHYELIRYSNVLNYTVVGGLSRLISFGMHELGIKCLHSYADRRYSRDANGYISCGFTHCGIVKPGYMYWRNNKYYNRIKFQKHKLAKLLTQFDSSKTEAENMFNNGYRRIWDAGHHRLVKCNEN